MTTERDEIIIEGSYDGVEWREYEFRYKPGDIAREPRWNIPHQPRLDWQMWFAALEDPRRLVWFSRFLERLLQNEDRKSTRLNSSHLGISYAVFCLKKKKKNEIKKVHATCR